MASAGDAGPAGDLKQVENLIRKFRKKLRQIENLERLNRSLSEEEAIKVQSKAAVREQLKSALEKLQIIEEDISLNREDNGLNESSDIDVTVSSLSEVEVEHLDDSIDSLNDTRSQGDAPLNQTEIINDVIEHSTLDDGLKVANSDTPSQSKLIKEKEATSDVKSQDKGKAKKSKASLLSQSLCRVSGLEGHNDLITSLVVAGDRLISASRDTTLRCWDIKTGTELHIFGGHTETVTCVTALSTACTPDIDPTLSPEDQIIVSGSFDCTIKLWSLKSGKLIKSVYTFNPVTCISTCQHKGLLVSGSDGGKLEIWDLVSGNNLWSNIVHGDSVSGLKVWEDSVYSGSAAGVIKVHQMTSGTSLVCLFESENLKSTSGRAMNVRHVRCLEFGPSGLLYGDDSKNIKIVDWKKGVVKKVPNHKTSFTSMDAVHCHKDYLFSSSYDLDSGLGYINVRCSRTTDYLATIDDSDTERIVCLYANSLPDGTLVVISGGLELKVWEIGKKDDHWRTCGHVGESKLVSVNYRRHLTQRAVDSDSDMSDDEEGVYDDESEDDEDDVVDKDGAGKDQSAGWGSWCSVL